MVIGSNYCIFSLLMFLFTLGNFSTFHDACYCMRSELSSAFNGPKFRYNYIILYNCERSELSGEFNGTDFLYIGLLVNKKFQQIRKGI